MFLPKTESCEMGQLSGFPGNMYYIIINYNYDYIIFSQNYWTPILYLFVANTYKVHTWSTVYSTHKLARNHAKQFFVYHVKIFHKFLQTIISAKLQLLNHVLKWINIKRLFNECEKNTQVHRVTSVKCTSHPQFIRYRSMLSIWS